MSIWRTLGIQETNDKIKVKRAYAERLKQCKPDENPEGFQALHTAYKQALNHIKYQQETPQLEEEPTKLDDENTNDSAIEQPQQSTEDKAWLAQMELNYKESTERALSVISEPSRRNDLAEWQFLAQSQFILEPEFNRQLGMYIIDKVMKVNEAFRELSKKKRRYAGANSQMQSSVLRYLNSIFHWNGQINQLRYYLGDDITLRVLDSIEITDHNTDPLLATQAVVGGKIKTSKKSNIDHSTIYTASSAALAKLKRLVYWVNGVFFVMLSLFLVFGTDKAVTSYLVASLLFIVLYSLQTYGVYKQNKYAIWSLWLTAISLTCAFPWGTYFGVSMMILLYKSHRFHNY